MIIIKIIAVLMFGVACFLSITTGIALGKNDTGSASILGWFVAFLFLTGAALVGIA